MAVQEKNNLEETSGPSKEAQSYLGKSPKLSLRLEHSARLYETNAALIGALRKEKSLLKKIKPLQKERIEILEKRRRYFQNSVYELIGQDEQDLQTRLSQELMDGLLKAQDMLIILAQNLEQPRVDTKEKKERIKALELKIDFYLQQWDHALHNRLGFQNLGDLLKNSKAQNTNNYYQLKKELDRNHNQKTVFWNKIPLSKSQKTALPDPDLKATRKKLKNDLKKCLDLDALYRDEEIRLYRKKPSLEFELITQILAARKTLAAQRSKKDRRQLEGRIKLYQTELEKLYEGALTESSLAQLIAHRAYQIGSEYIDLEAQVAHDKKTKKRKPKDVDHNKILKTKEKQLELYGRMQDFYKSECVRLAQPSPVLTIDLGDRLLKDFLAFEASKSTLGLPTAPAQGEQMSVYDPSSTQFTGQNEHEIDGSETLSSELLRNFSPITIANKSQSEKVNPISCRPRSKFGKNRFLAKLRT